MPELFHLVDGAQAVTYCKGVFRQVNVYQRAGALYLRHGSGFIMMRGIGRTSHPDTSVKDLVLPPGLVVTENPARGVVLLGEAP